MLAFLDSEKKMADLRNIIYSILSLGNSYLTGLSSFSVCIKISLSSRKSRLLIFISLTRDGRTDAFEESAITLALFISFKRNNRANMITLFSKASVRPGVNVMNINNRDLGLERDILIQTKQRDKAVK